MFRGCDRVTGINLPDTVAYIGGYAFYNCTANITITLPAGYSGQPNAGAFSGCSSNMAFASGTTQVPYHALIISDTRHITIPSSVTRIGTGAFEYCYSLFDITFGGTMEQWENVVKDSDWNKGTGTVTVICPDGNLEVDG